MFNFFRFGEWKISKEKSKYFFFIFGVAITSETRWSNLLFTIKLMHQHGRHILIFTQQSIPYFLFFIFKNSKYFFKNFKILWNFYCTAVRKWLLNLLWAMSVRKNFWTMLRTSLDHSPPKWMSPWTRHSLNYAKRTIMPHLLTSNISASRTVPLI